MGKGLTQDELKTLVHTEMRQSLGYTSSKLANARQKAMIYYLALPVSDLSPPEIEGRSSVISTDVRDTIEAMLPQLMVTFCGGDSVVEFEPQNPDDEPKAKQATEYINYLFFKKNNGHRISYTWMKDALLQKNGIVKCWWDTRWEETKEEYKALSQIELAQVLDDPEIEVIDQQASPDPDDAKARQQAIEQIAQKMQQAMQAAQSGDQQTAQAIPQLQQQYQQIQAQPPVMVYDISCKRVKKGGKIQIDNVPPEEFLIARNAKDIETARFVGHRVQRTISELKSMGYKNVDNISGEEQSQSANIERIQRLQYNDENAYLSDEIITADDASRKVWITEAYVRCDFDGDGIVELRKVTVAGNELLDNEEIDYIPFVDITPVPLPHTFFGLSIADLAMESQRTKTSILRSQLDNLYLNVNGRYFAVEGQVNLDDLLTSRPGGVVRVKHPNSVGRLDQGHGDSGESMQMMEYMQQDLENRTGWSRQSMGNDASGLHTGTATQANIVTNKADMRLDLIARNFAEGYTALFKLMLKLICQHQDKGAQVKLSGGWADIDPREWRNQFDVSINVGIGLGNKDQKINQLMALGQRQQEGFQIGVSNPTNVFNLNAEMAKTMGYKNADRFFTDPSKQPPPPPPPDPEAAKAQAQMQIEQAKMQATMQIETQKLQQQAQIEQMKRQQELELEKAKMQMQAEVDNNRQRAEAEQKQMEMQQQAQLDQLRAQFENERHMAKMQYDQWKAQGDWENKLMIAELQSKTTLTAQQNAAAEAAEYDETQERGE